MAFMFNDFYSTADSFSLSKRAIMVKGIYSFLKYMIIAFLLGSILLALEHFHLVNKDYLIPSSIESRYNHIWGYLYPTLFGPFLEEIAFRLGLDFKKKHVIISFPIFIYILLSIITKTSYYTELIYKIPICAIVAVLLYKMPMRYWNTLKEKYGKYVIITSVIVFALLHLFHYHFYLPYFLLYGILCFPQFVTGAIITYYRLNLGFFYGVAFHIIFDSAIFFLNLSLLIR